MYFSKFHIWLSDSDDGVRLGVSDFAQSRLGGIMFLNLPEVGESVVMGERFGDIESVKTVSDLISPVSGEVIAVHHNLLDTPDVINGSPYDCWLITVKITVRDGGLMDEAAYFEYIKTL
ncbi:MAG: glycine cleavage system protein H [Clostridium sp.]|nr:glycine cleavage system protein H [Clostridium sp.]